MPVFLYRVASMQETGSDSLLFLAQEQMTFSNFLQPQTWLVQGSGCSELTRPVLRPEVVTREVNKLL